MSSVKRSNSGARTHARTHTNTPTRTHTYTHTNARTRTLVRAHKRAHALIFIHTRAHISTVVTRKRQGYSWWGTCKQISSRTVKKLYKVQYSGKTHRKSCQRLLFKVICMNVLCVRCCKYSNEFSGSRFTQKSFKWKIQSNLLIIG